MGKQDNTAELTVNRDALKAAAERANQEHRSLADVTMTLLRDYATGRTWLNLPVDNVMVQPTGLSPDMQRWLENEADVCAMSMEAVVAAALIEYRARRTPESRIRFRDGTPNYHYGNVEFIEDGH